MTSKSGAWVPQALKCTGQQILYLRCSKDLRIIPYSSEQVDLSDIDAEGRYSPKRGPLLETARLMREALRHAGGANEGGSHDELD